jgi:hypothetical protein
VSDIRSVPGGCSRFSRCCYLIIDLSSHLFGGSWAPGVSRSHLDSAVELGCPDRNSLARFIREGQLSEEFLYERDNGRIVEEFG